MSECRDHTGSRMGWEPGSSSVTKAAPGQSNLQKVDKPDKTPQATWNEDLLWPTRSFKMQPLLYCQPHLSLLCHTQPSRHGLLAILWTCQAGLYLSTFAVAVASAWKLLSLDIQTAHSLTSSKSFKSHLLNEITTAPAGLDPLPCSLFFTHALSSSELNRLLRMSIVCLSHFFLCLLM